MSVMNSEDILRNYGRGGDLADWTAPRMNKALNETGVKLALSEEQIEARDSLRARRYEGLGFLKGHLFKLLDRVLSTEEFPTAPMIDQEVARTNSDPYRIAEVDSKEPVATYLASGGSHWYIPECGEPARII